MGFYAKNERGASDVSEEYVRIALDAMGGDNAPGEIVQGAIEGLSKNPSAKIILVGREAEINKELSAYTYDKSRVEVVNANSVISTEEVPTAAVRTKKDSSIVVAMELFKDGKADCVASAGSTGAIFVAATKYIKRIQGIERTPLGAVIPVDGGVSILVDSGANVDAKASQLVQYARMGSIYMEKVHGVNRPRVGLVNVGVEEEKGNALTKETYQLLKECKDINFIGNIEAREIPSFVADVLVCDAFAGNCMLKMYEGTASTLLKVVKGGLTSSFKSKIGALLIKKSLKQSLKPFDASEYGGAPFLGLNGLVVKMHGSSKHKEVCAAIGQCVAFHKSNIAALIDENIAKESRIQRENEIKANLAKNAENA